VRAANEQQGLGQGEHGFRFEEGTTLLSAIERWLELSIAPSFIGSLFTSPTKQLLPYATTAQARFLS